MRSLSARALICLCAGAFPLSAQCPDGTPPPCAQLRQSVAPARPPPPAHVRARRMLLLPFRNVTRAPAHDWLATGAPLMLSDALGQYRDLALVPEERLTAARRRLALVSDAPLDETQLRRLADETDGWTAVTGNVLAAGGQLRISAQALDIPTARVLVRAETSVPVDADVRPAFDQLGVQLLEAVGVRAAPTDVAALTTQSVDAYRAYVQGIQQLQRSAYRDARASFAEAVRLDSTFALAWAKLALASMSASIFDIVQPSNQIARAVNRAMTNAGRLPPRQMLLIRSMQLFMQGQPTRARLLADSLVQSDRDDFDAKEWLASVTTMDPTLDVTTRPPRLRASFNQPVLLAKEILERDPGRRHVYSIPVSVYTMSAAWGIGKVGVSGEYGSIGAMLMASLARQEAVFVPVLRDTLVPMLRSDVEKLPAGERRTLQARSVDAANQWLERWLAAGPDDSDAHLWASRLADVQGDYARALREAVIAESLGVQSGWENVRGRRLRLLVNTGEHAPAAALADSMLQRREFANALPISLDQGRGYAAAIFTLRKEWQKLASLVDGTVVLNPFGVGTKCLNIVNELERLRDRDPAMLRAVMDTAAAHFGALAGASSLVGCAGNFAGTLLVDSTTNLRTFGAAMLMAKGDSLRRAGNEALGYRAMRQAWIADTSVSARARLLGDAWFMTRSRAMAFTRTFVPEAAIVSGDSAMFSYRATEAGPWELSYPELPSYWSFSVEVTADSTSFTVLARHEYQQRDGLKTGGIPEMLAGLGQRRVLVQPYNAIGVASSVSAQAAGRGFRLVVRGPAVAELRRLAPRVATFRSEPCLALTDGLCGEPTLGIEYRP